MYLQAVTDETGNVFHHTEVQRLTEQMRKAEVRIFVCVNNVPEYFMYVVKTGKRVGTIIATLALAEEITQSTLLTGMAHILGVYPNIYISPKSSRYTPDIVLIAPTSLGMLKANQKESYKCRYTLSGVKEELLLLQDIR